MKQKEWYWIAINGASCALASLPFKKPATIPVAEQLLGFPTLSEAQEAQRICLNEPMPKVERFLKGLAPAVRAGRIQVIQPPNPQPPIKGGQMAWMESEESELKAYVDQHGPLRSADEFMDEMRKAQEETGAKELVLVVGLNGKPKIIVGSDAAMRLRAKSELESLIALGGIPIGIVALKIYSVGPSQKRRRLMVSPFPEVDSEQATKVLSEIAHASRDEMIRKGLWK